ncbi:hypothetical protein YYC_05352 [Plasmodium yoelii 17X]|uniref:Uncharacterized protein n=1 Tax=Plasmodium yoelii 17X TaxID=1323249 RepID=V7PDC3_PLAYE|nr:hypothetical protein YYC_05352 [Plasmodium yoelii 17X]
MDKVCQKFDNVWEDFPDTLTKDGKYQFNDETFLNSYCNHNGCKGDLDKINAVFFYLINQFFGPSGFFKDNVKNNINAVEYILIWLSHMLNLKENKGNILTIFYKVYIYNQEKYKNPINGVDGCRNYDDFIYTKNELMNITNEKLSKFYAPFKSLCTMYNGFNDSTSDCKTCLNHANEFANKYKELSEDSSITNDSTCNKLLSTLSNDYNKFKEYCNSKGSKCKDYPDIPTIKEIQTSSKKIVQSSEDTSSSSSVTNKLFTVLSIFGVIAFLLGISYKYSLFGFRKRFQKQKLREKIKNIKKKMNQ